jgi:hypothetical protein
VLSYLEKGHSKPLRSNVPGAAVGGDLSVAGHGLLSLAETVQLWGKK